MLEAWIRKEIARQKSSGTYFFYGEDIGELQKTLLSFAKALCCLKEEDYFCGQCEVCQRIDKGLYSDIHILDQIKIDDIRNLDLVFHEAAYEGERKIFILSNIQDLKKEAANALLKLIEEPGEGSFFLLWGKHRNILSTLRSRSIEVFVPRRHFKDLGVSQECYEFFAGETKDIEEVLEKNLDWGKPANYKNIRKYLEDYTLEHSIEDKIAVYGALWDFFTNRSYLSVAEKIWFVEEIIALNPDRELIAAIVHYWLLISRHEEGMEKRFFLQKMFHFPINAKLLLTNLFFL